MAAFPPDGFVTLISPPVHWIPLGPNLETLQGYVCNPLKSAIGILVTEGNRIGQVLHVDWIGRDYLEGLRGLLVTDEHAVTHTTEVCLQFDPERGVSVAMRADTDAIPMQVAVDRVASLKRQHDERRALEAARAEEEAKKIAEAVATPPAEEPSTVAATPATPN